MIDIYTFYHTHATAYDIESSNLNYNINLKRQVFILDLKKIHIFIHKTNTISTYISCTLIIDLKKYKWGNFMIFSNMKERKDTKSLQKKRKGRDSELTCSSTTIIKGTIGFCYQLYFLFFERIINFIFHVPL